MASERIAVFCALLVIAAPSEAVDVTPERVEALEKRNAVLEQQNQDLARRLDDLEAREQERERVESARQDAELGAGLADWARRIRVSGSANMGYYRGDDSPFQDLSFQVWDARFFLDADLGRDVRIGELPIARNVGFTFEWNLVRLGEVQSDSGATQVGEIFVELQRLGDQPWLNAQVGRFQIPVGENYLRFSKGYKDNPFITNTVGGPWWWDEGVRVYGSDERRRFGYVASISDGDTPFASDSSREPQGTLKLWVEPTRWLHASVSGLFSGETRRGALWLGEIWATPIGAMSDLPTFQDGAIVPPAPGQIDTSSLLAADVILTHEKLGRLWLGGGRWGIDAADSGYDRDLWYWIAEAILEGRALSPELAPFYLALRANGFGTYDDDAGYILDVRDADRFGYNAQLLHAYSIALGWRLTRWTTLRLEYTRRYVELVDGVPSQWTSDAGGQDQLGVELGVWF
jgi:hypothetical protein